MTYGNTYATTWNAHTCSTVHTHINQTGETIWSLQVMHHSPYVISEQQYCGRSTHSMNILYIATPLHLGESLGLIEQWGLNISDTAPPEHSFIISHVQSVIRPRGGPWMVDFELPPVYCSPAPAVRLSTVSTRSRPTSYSCGRTVIMTVWTLSAGSLCVHVCVWWREPWCHPDLLSSSPQHQQGEGARWRGTKSNVAGVLQGRLAYSSKSTGWNVLRYSIEYSIFKDIEYIGFKYNLDTFYLTWVFRFLATLQIEGKYCTSNQSSVSHLYPCAFF